jgi:hypothetical protein
VCLRLEPRADRQEVRLPGLRAERDLHVHPLYEPDLLSSGSLSDGYLMLALPAALSAGVIATWSP